MRLWAFGTSPHGLGLADERFWDLTPREYYALADVQQGETKRWACQMAMTINMNLASGSVPFIADDFLGYGDRERRVRQKMASDYEVGRINRQLTIMDITMRQKLKAGEEPPDLPLWCQKNPKPLEKETLN